MQVKKEELFTLTATLGMVKAAIKKVIPNYQPEICDNIVFNRVSEAITKKAAENKGA